MNTTYGNSQNAPTWSGKLKDQPAGERPRERLIEHGAAALSAAELIAILVKTGLPGTNALDIGKQLIQKFGSLGAMAKATVDELQCIRGIGRDKAVTLVAAFTLASKMAEELQRESPVLDNPQAIVELLRDQNRIKNVETFQVAVANAAAPSLAKSRKGIHITVAPRKAVRRPGAFSLTFARKTWIRKFQTCLNRIRFRQIGWMTCWHGLMRKRSMSPNPPGSWSNKSARRLKR